MGRMLGRSARVSPRAKVPDARSAVHEIGGWADWTSNEAPGAIGINSPAGDEPSFVAVASSTTMKSAAPTARTGLDAISNKMMMRFIAAVVPIRSAKERCRPQ